MMSNLLFGIALSVFSCVCNVVTLLPWLIYTDLSTSSYHFSLSDITRISLNIYSGTHSCCCIYCSFENNRHADIMSSIVSHVLYIVCIHRNVSFSLISCLFVFIFSFCIQISPRHPQECVFFTNKLPVCTPDTLSIHYFVLPFFNDASNLAFVCFITSFLGYW